ncbi:LEAF RUST 10 DISEASE-RESISTANCE LOCUS RECEPTOR-LIKE PROTEIN KINASE-like 2.1 [Senna tora]|uniref:LEAF RUST 10 DISEASE-RESISTANCE LOCUS RECEPTOR-LIKE PROTEIN KINASE-like 2.1 n=1 Tax=Senna tora TaxID=362788 RepID=A0A834U1D2_9FABA|nr:LEAF RUST 10 DISEASE-RESISTANCE LOCUS RECEPTOR-LIKE PROTEIN KINASE-like 2.1 [Senna tora]
MDTAVEKEGLAIASLSYINKNLKRSKRSRERRHRHSEMIPCMRRGKALSWSSWCLSSMLFTLLLMQEVSGEGCASSCGNFTNIKHPFRLQNDPPNCGNPRYELACENNVTLLHLFSGKYKVLGINYNNYTIRIVDPGIQQDDCSSLPRYFFYRLNFSDFNDYGSTTPEDPYRASLDNSRVYMFEQIIYLKCRNGVVRKEYVDTPPCLNLEWEGHVYAVVGDLAVGNLTDECEVKLVGSIRRDWRSLLGNENWSYAEIESVLWFGFEISWWPAACNCSSGEDCRFDGTTPTVECVPTPQCHTPMGYLKQPCGHLSKLRIFAEVYLYGLIKGFVRIGGWHRLDPDTDYHFGLSQLGLDMGVVTGGYIIPYTVVRFLLDIEDFLQLQDLIPVRYSYKDLKMMTNGFNTKLGQGGFGTVYQGKLRSGPLVAIKMLGKSTGNCQDFISEVATIGRIHHFNVVHLIGFCVEGSNHALVYEFMYNGSLDKYIFSKEGSAPLNYTKIYEISLGIARGIAYLHHGCDMQILHFDIKPHNILLDDNFNPKISDFGLAKLYHVDDSIVNLTAARGTIGYMAPELFYKNIGGVSYKADVYSFGMLLMELANRRRNLNSQAEHSSQVYFPLWIYDQFAEEEDIEMEGLTKEETDLAKKMFIVALWCIQLKPSDRPSMNKVVEMLEGEVESLEMPPKPSLYPHEIVAVDHKFDSDQRTSSDSINSPSHSSDVILESSTSNGEMVPIYYLVFLGLRKSHLNNIESMSSATEGGLSREEKDQVERSSKKVKTHDETEEDMIMVTDVIGSKVPSDSESPKGSGFVSSRDKLTGNVPAQDVDMSLSDSEEESDYDDDSNSDASSEENAWVRIPGLPLEFYNVHCLQRIGGLIGRTIKVDPTTSLTSRGKFARICVEINLKKQLVPQVEVRGRSYAVEYEGLHLICFQCGRYGHSKDLCMLKKETEVKEKTQQVDLNIVPKDGGHGVDDGGDMIPASEGVVQEAGNDNDGVFGPWMTVNRPKRGKNQNQFPKRNVVNNGVQPNRYQFSNPMFDSRLNGGGGPKSFARSSSVNVNQHLQAHFPPLPKKPTENRIQNGVTCVPREPPDRRGRNRTARSRDDRAVANGGPTPVYEGSVEANDVVASVNGAMARASDGDAAVASPPAREAEAMASGMDVEEPKGAQC